jgi:L-amino acid N-acyltransferase YncA
VLSTGPRVSPLRRSVPARGCLRIRSVRYEIDHLTANDWAQVRVIYLEGVATGDATFETDAPDWEEWDRNHLAVGRLVARDGERVIGWAALGAVSSRSVYKGVAEVSVYVAAPARGWGVGRSLLGALIDEAEANNVWTLQAGVFPENVASIKLHKAFGFREVGRRERIGRLRGIWRDVILLERRSRVVGA